MGVVYRAEQDYPRRIVALKVIKGPLADSRSRDRFEREIAILARLHHRGIAQLFSAGLLEQQSGGAAPFMAMEFVEGVPLNAYAEKSNLSIDARIGLLAKACDILAYAHDQGVIHRDLKPSNILVDSAGDPKILDFGLAAVKDSAGDCPRQLTLQGQLVGTLDYMSPEQALGQTQDVDEQSDVYSLGVILYELLASRRPFDLSNRNLVDAVRVIDESAPPPMSSTGWSVSGDLETMVHKALCKEKSGRYRSVKELADDLRRFQAFEPVHARRPSAIYRAGKFLRRNRLFVTATALIILSLSIGLVMAARAASRATAAAALATLRQHDAELQLNVTRVAQADGSLLAGRYVEARRLYDDAWNGFESLGESPLRAELGIWDVDLQSARRIRILEQDGSQMLQFAFSPDQKWIGLGYKDGRVEIRDVVTNATHVGFKLDGNINRLVFSPDSASVLAFSTDHLEIWTIQNARRIAVRKIAIASPQLLQLGNDAFAFVTRDGNVQVDAISTPDKARDISLGSRGCRTMAFANSTIIIVDESWHVIQRSPDAGNWMDLGMLPFKMESGVCLSPDGKYVAVVDDNAAAIYKVEGLKKQFEREGFTRKNPFGFNNQDAFFATNQASTITEVFSANGDELRKIPVNPFSQIAVSNNFASVSSTTSPLVLWSIAPSPEIRQVSAASARPLVSALSSDGLVAAMATDDDQVVLIDTQAGHQLGHLNVHAKLLSFDGGTRRLAVVTDDNRLQIWNVQECVKECDIQPGSIRAFAFSQAGDLAAFVLGSSNQIGLLRQTGRGWSQQLIDVSGMDTITVIAISSDSKRMTIADMETHGQLWNLEQRPRVQAVWAIPIYAGAIAFASGDRLVLISQLASSDVHVMDASTGAEKGIMPLMGTVVGMAPCRLPIAMAVDSDALYAFDLDRCELLRRLPLPLKFPRKVSLSDDGSKVLIANKLGESLLVDFSFPALFRTPPETSAAHSAGQVSDSLQQARWFVASGLANQAFPVYVVERDRVLRAPMLRDGFAYWAAGDVTAAATIFQDTKGLSPGARELLIAGTGQASSLR